MSPPFYPPGFDRRTDGFAEVDDLGRPIDDSDPWLEREYDRQQVMHIAHAQKVRAEKEAAR